MVCRPMSAAPSGIFDVSKPLPRAVSISRTVPAERPDIIHCQGWISSIAPLYIKTSYHEEPSFRDSRIIFTPGGEELSLPTTEQFCASLQFKGMTGNELKDFPETLTQKDLYKLALKYSDGMLLSPSYQDPELIEYAHSLNLPVFGPVDPSLPDTGAQVMDYFDSIWGGDHVEEES